MNRRAWVFDAYGTLFDVRSVLAHCEAAFAGHGEAITTLWRARQLEYSWLRSLMGNYKDFWQLTEDGLRYTCQALGLSASSGQIEHIMHSYLTISPFQDTVANLEKLAATGCSLSILSNGTPTMLKAAVTNAGLDGSLAHIISVDEVKIYKPHPSVYRLACERLALAKEEISFVSSNGWDAAGAKAFGFRVYWLNRAGQPVEELEARPDKVITSLAELLSEDI